MNRLLSSIPKRIFPILLLLSAFYSDAQTLFVPNGFSASGIGSSSTGNVGIGTSSPGAMLDVKYNGGALTNLYRATDQNGQFRWRVDQIFNMALTNAAGKDIATIGQNITWFNSGNVGIGTSSPSSLLQVNGGAIMASNSTFTSINARLDASNQFPALRLTRWTGGTNNHNAFIGQVLNAATQQYVLQIGTGNGTSTSPVPTGGNPVQDFYVPAITIDLSQNVGIGTISPDAKLAVKGIIHTQEVKVDLTGAMAPDYVFEKNYALPSIQKVKEYIEQNKHLPEIPSAAELERDGMNLKEMNLLMLKKIEELTLYIIEQEKRISELESVAKK